jgi:glycerophosphoryl diester phosphodiesterase
MSRPLVLGHRGARASRSIPENTIASFELCLEHGCDGFEFDLRRSADGQAVVCHDAATGGLNIAETAAKDLGLPSLVQVLQRFSSRAFLDIELKVAGLERQTWSALQAFPPQKGYVVSSFLPEVLRTLDALDASVWLGLLCETPECFGRFRESPAQWVIPRTDLADRTLVDELHHAGKKVMVWTVNGVDEMHRLAEWGVEAIISDETELAVGILRT